jgi:hypothetical protein
VIFVIARPPKSRFAMKLRLPENQTSTGHVTIAVLASDILLLAMGLIAVPVVANSTYRITGEGICPLCRIVTAVRLPVVFTS